MRCTCCNRGLTDYEATMRHPVTKDFLDICQKCMPDTGIEPITRRDLKEEKEEEDDLYYEMYEDDDDLDEDEQD